MATQLFAKATTTPGVKPPTNLSSWAATNISQQGNNAKTLQLAVTSAFASSAPSQTLGIGSTSIGNLTCCSDTLAAQAITSQTLTVGFCTQYKSLVAATTTVRPRVAVYLMDGTLGTIKATILGLTALGASAAVASTSVQFVTNFSNSFVSTLVNAAQGDFIALDLGHQLTLTAGDTDNVGFSYSGNTLIVADNGIGVADSRCYITFANDLIFGSGSSANVYSEPDAYAFQSGLYIPIGPIA